MNPEPAEIARTMASGRLEGLLHLPRRPAELPVRHVADPAGHPLLLTPRAGSLAAALAPPAGQLDTAAVLRIDDAPPVLGAPCHGRLWLSGWVSRLSGAEARRAAYAYAEVDPCGDLLNLDDGHALYRLTVAEARLVDTVRTIEIDPDDYLAATPDPLHLEEPALLAELAAYGGRRLRALYRSLAGDRPPPGARAVRIDRFGVVLTVPHRSRTLRRVRLDFPTPLTGRHQLATLAT